MTEADLPVLAEQVKALRAAVENLLRTRTNEARAYSSLQVALENFSDHGRMEHSRYFYALEASSKAEQEARALILTLKEVR